jgi:hypothetical protein
MNYPQNTKTHGQNNHTHVASRNYILYDVKTEYYSLKISQVTFPPPLHLIVLRLSCLYHNWYKCNWTKCSNIAWEFHKRFIIFIKKLKTNDSMQIEGWSKIAINKKTKRNMGLDKG